MAPPGMAKRGLSSLGSASPRKKASFGPNLIKGKSEKAGLIAPAALRVCSLFFDKHPDEAAADSAATGHFLSGNCRGKDHKWADEKDAVGAECANTTGMASTSTDELDLKKLARKPKAASKCDKFKNMSTSLLPARQFDEEADLAAVFHNRKVTVVGSEDKDFEIAGGAMLEGNLKPNGLCMAKLHGDDALTANNCPCPAFKNMGSPPDEHAQHRANALAIRTVPALIDYYHMCLGAPPIKSWLAAIDKRWFASWHGLTADLVRKCCSDKPQTTHGHMQRLRQHADSTKTADDYEHVPEDEEEEPTKAVDELKAELRPKRHKVEACLLGDMTNAAAMDITGRCPVVSNRGHKCIFVLLDRGASHICLQPMKSRKSHDIVEAHESCHSRLTKKGSTAKLVRLDNEISKELIAAIKSGKQCYQIAAAGDHRNNQAEIAIRLIKAHFISVRACADKNFDPRDWDSLLPHTEHTGNMLHRPSKINPLVPAHTMVNGHHEFRKHPFAPAGTKVIVHESKLIRGTWGDRGVDGFFVEMAPKHYRNVRCFIPSTNDFKVPNTIEYFPECCRVPTTEPLDHTSHCIQQLKEAICDSRASNLFFGKSAAFMQAMRELEQILGVEHRSTTTPNPTPSASPSSAPTSKGASEPVRTSKGAREGARDGPVTRSRPKTMRACPNGTIV